MFNQKISIHYEGIGLSFEDENERPLVDEVNFYEGLDKNFQPATDILVPFETYKQFTLEAIDAYQQRHYHKGLARARQQFLPKNMGLDQENEACTTDTENVAMDVPISDLQRALFSTIYDKSDPNWSLFYYLNMVYNNGYFIYAIEQLIHKRSYGDISPSGANIMRIEFRDTDYQWSTKTVMLTLDSYLDYVIFTPFEMFSTILLEAIDIYQSKHYKKTLSLYRHKLTQMDNETPTTYNEKMYERYKLQDDDDDVYE